MQLVKAISRDQGKSVVIVSHDHRIRDIADQVLWMEDGRLREVRSVKDPVCGMVLDEALAPVRLQWGKETYYFCGQVCKQTFISAHPLPADVSSQVG